MEQVERFQIVFKGEVMQLKWLVHSAGKIGYFAFLWTFFKVYVALSLSGEELRGKVHSQKFLFVEISKNSGTEVSTPLVTIEISDFFGPAMVCA